MTLKTLKDIENSYVEINATRRVSDVIDNIRKKTIKWVKEDLDNIRLKNDFGDTIWEPIHITKKWMERFNIIEEDLND